MKNVPNGILIDVEMGFVTRNQVEKNGYWYNARPMSYQGVISRLRLAWEVFVGRADALYWAIDLTD